MLSYQHIYHAGNVVDCQKHTILSALLNILHQDASPYCYIDTHSGRGLYDLEAPEAQKIREYKDGIHKLWAQKKWPEVLSSYKALLQKLNPKGPCRYYPGSPYVGYAHMRSQDKLELYEIHPQELTALHDEMGDLDGVEIYNMDGWEVLQEYVPPQEKRGVVLIDPSYELKDEYLSLPAHLHAAYQLWPEGIYMIWYPILAPGRHLEMLVSLRKTGIKNILKNEIMLDSDKGLLGTGLLIVNAPTGFDKTVEEISAWLTSSIGKSTTTEKLS